MEQSWTALEGPSALGIPPQFPVSSFKSQFNGPLLGAHLTSWHPLSRVIRAAMSTSAAIHIVSPVQFDSATVQTSGSDRRAALAPAPGTASPVWGDLSAVAPGSRT